MTAPSLTLYPKASKALLLLLISAAFVAIGLWLGSDGEWMGYLCAAFFGLGIPVALVQLVPGSGFLRIEADGFTFASLFRKHSLRWSDIDCFYVVTLRNHGMKTMDMVAFNYSPTYDRMRTARAFAKVIAGAEGALPDTYGRKASALADLLNIRLHEARMQASR
jgi:hypothetical protein